MGYANLQGVSLLHPHNFARACDASCCASVLCKRVTDFVKHAVDPGLWYVGGTLGHQRFLSRFLAMQIKAKLSGTPLPVYKRQPQRSPSAQL